MSIPYGELNGPSIGILMKELIRRAIDAIRNVRLTFEIHEKFTEGKDKDFYTTADLAAQAAYIKGLQEYFPAYGIVAEEENLIVKCTHPTLNIYFSVDSLDGTKAFMRRQSHGVGTMLSLMCNGRIIAAYVGDTNTQEIFGFRPESSKTHRVSEFRINENLVIDPIRPLADQNVLLRDPLDKFSPLVRALVGPAKQGGLFKSHEITGGSIGLSTARIWKSEVGATVLRPSNDTPWDMWPLIGICKQMGFAFLRPTADGRTFEQFEQYEPVVSTSTVKRTHDVLIIHQSRIPELMAWESQIQG